MPPAIELSAVRKVYGSGDGAAVAVGGVDLTVEPGRFVSLIGPSGCGKSTLLRLVAGLEKPDAGTVRVHGVTPEDACAAKLIGFVPQDPALLPWLSVYKNVTLPRSINPGAARRRAKITGRAERGAGPDVAELLRKVGLGDDMHKLPAQLSGGMRQRAAIARAFGLRPDVLVMDEPFSALDEFTRESLQDQLLELWAEPAGHAEPARHAEPAGQAGQDGGKTSVLFVTHSVAEAVRLSDTIVVMAPNPGRIADVIDMDLARPRDQRDPRFHEQEDLVRDKLRGAWQLTDAA